MGDISRRAATLPPVTASLPPSPISWRHEIAVAFLFLGIGLTLLGSTLWHLDFRMVGFAGSDAWEHMWGKWWRYRELRQGNPFPDQTLLLGFPRGGRLWEPDPIGGWLSIPLQALWGMPAAHNLLAALTIALNGWSTYILVRPEVSRRLFALLGGVLVAVSPFSLSLIANGVGEQQHLWLCALFLWAWLRFLRAPTWRRALPLWGTAAAMAVANVYFVIFLGVGALLLWWWVDSETREGVPRPHPLGVALVGGGPPFAVAFLWYGFYAAYLADPNRVDARDTERLLSTPDLLLHAWPEGIFLSPRVSLDGLSGSLWLLAFLGMAASLLLLLRRLRARPSRWSSLGGPMGILLLSLCLGLTASALFSRVIAEPSLAASWRVATLAPKLAMSHFPEWFPRYFSPFWMTALRTPRPVGEGNQMVHLAYLGPTVLLLMALALGTRQRARKWGGLALLGLLWSFGPRLLLPEWWGNLTGWEGIPSPYQWVFLHVPPFSDLQFVYRAHILTLLGGAVMVAMGMEWLIFQGAGKVGGLCLLLLGLELGPLSPLPGALPWASLPNVEGLEVITRSKEPGAVLELPSYSDGEIGRGYTLYGQMIHGRSIPQLIQPGLPKVLADNSFIRFTDLNLNGGPEVYSTADEDTVIRGIADLYIKNIRFLVIRRDLPYSGNQVRADALIHLLEQGVGWKPLARNPHVYAVRLTEKMADPSVLFLRTVEEAREISSEPPASTP